MSLDSEDVNGLDAFLIIFPSPIREGYPEDGGGINNNIRN